MRHFNQPTFTPPPQLPAPEGPVYPLPEPEARALALRSIEDNRERQRRAQQPQRPIQHERMTDTDAKALLAKAKAALAEIRTITEQLRQRSAAADAAVRAAETELSTMQSVYRSALEMVATNPGAARPRDVAQDIQILRAKIGMKIDAADEARRDYAGASENFQTATASARVMIDNAVHHQRMNSVDALSDKLEALVREAALTEAALRGHLDYFVLARDDAGIKFTNAAMIGQKCRTAQEEADRRTTVRKECDDVREHYQRTGLFRNDGGAQ